MFTKVLRRGRALPVLGAIVALGAIAVGISILSPGSSVKEANAQGFGPCTEYRICISKETIPGSSVEFAFLFEFDSVEHSQVGGAIVEEPTMVELSDGDETGIYFTGDAKITELPRQGWELVDIRCEGTRDFDVERSGNSIVITYLEGTSQSYLNCTFINREVRQPLNLGGLFAGQPTPLPTAPAAVAPAATSPTITPPRTGDAGIK